VSWPGMVVHNCNSITWWEGGLRQEDRVQVQPELHDVNFICSEPHNCVPSAAYNSKPLNQAGYTYKHTQLPKTQHPLTKILHRLRTSKSNCSYITSHYGFCLSLNTYIWTVHVYGLPCDALTCTNIV
jgi:hypothetical protein